MFVFRENVYVSCWKIIYSIDKSFLARHHVKKKIWTIKLLGLASKAHRAFPRRKEGEVCSDAWVTSVPHRELRKNMSNEFPPTFVKHDRLVAGESLSFWGNQVLHKGPRRSWLLIGHRDHDDSAHRSVQGTIVWYRKHSDPHSQILESPHRGEVHSVGRSSMR